MALAEGWMVPSTKVDFSDPDIITSRIARTDLVSVELTESAPQGTFAVAYSPTLKLWVAAALGNLGIADPAVAADLWYSTDGGDTWAAAGAPIADIIMSAVVWTGERFIAIGGTGTTSPMPPNLIATSEDGKTWTLRSTPLDGVTAYDTQGFGSPQSAHLTCISGSGDNWFAGGPNLSTTPAGGTLPGDIFLVGVYSHDGGLTWSNATMPTFYDPVSELTYSGSVGQSLWDGSKFVGLEAVNASFNTQTTYVSADGSSWELTGLGPGYVPFGGGGGDDLYAPSNTIAKLGGVLYVFGQRLNPITFLADPVYWTSTDDGATWVGFFADTVPDDGDSLYNLVVHGVMFRSGINLLTVIDDGNDWQSPIFFARGDPSPWDSVDTGYATYWGGYQGGAMPYMDYGKFGGAIPLRRYPRDDGLGASTKRGFPPSTATQSGLRRGPTAIT